MELIGLGTRKGYLPPLEHAQSKMRDDTCFDAVHDMWCNTLHGGEYCTCFLKIVAEDRRTGHTFILVDKR
jgi:hypothetical protein